MCSKAVECLQKLKGSRGAEVSPLKQENNRDRLLTTWMNQLTVTYSSGTVDHLCLVWPMFGTSLPVEMNVCVCVLSIIAGAYKCEVKHIPTSSMSLTVSCWASPACHTWVKEHAEVWLLHNQLRLTNQAKIYIFIFFLGSRKQNLTSSLSLCVYIFKILNKYQHLIVFIMQLTLWSRVAGGLLPIKNVTRGAWLVWYFIR